MKVRITVYGAFLIALALALNTAALAAQESQFKISGEVLKVDASSRTLILRNTSFNKMKEISMAVAPDATVMKGNRTFQLDKIAAGQKVMVKVTRKKGVFTAHEITLQIGAAYAPAPAKPKKG